MKFLFNIDHLNQIENYVKSTYIDKLYSALL